MRKRKQHAVQGAALTAVQYVLMIGTVAGLLLGWSDRTVIWLLTGTVVTGTVGIGEMIRALTLEIRDGGRS